MGGVLARRWVWSEAGAHGGGHPGTWPFGASVSLWRADPFLLAQVREQGGGKHTVHGAAPHLQATVGQSTCLVQASGEEGGPPPGQLGDAGARGGGTGPGLGKAFPLQPGRLKKVQGIGWYLDEKNLAQVSTNLLDFEVTALHTVYEETCREAKVSGRRPSLVGTLQVRGVVSPSGWGPSR